MNSKPIILIIVALNLALVLWILIRSDDSTEQQPHFPELVATSTMEKTSYDLSDRASKLNIIFISMDALRYDVTGLDGGESATRNLQIFAEESVVFHNATSAAPWTLPSHMSVWTARWPSIHQVTNKLKLLASNQMVENTLSPGIQTFPDLP